MANFDGPPWGPQEHRWGQAAGTWQGPYPGWGPTPGPHVTVAQAQDGNGLAVTSLVLGITGIVFCWWGLFTLAQVVLAIVFGGSGISKANRLGAPHKGPAVAGLVLGMAGLGSYFVLGLLSLGIGWLI